MKIIKFNESVSETLEDLFRIAEEEYEHIKDICAEIEDDKNISIGYNYIVFDPKHIYFETTECAIWGFNDVVNQFPTRVKDKIVFGDMIISYQIGIGLYKNFEYDYFNSLRGQIEEGDDIESTQYTYFDNQSIESMIKILTFMKQFTRRIDKKYHILHQIDNTGISILIGRKTKN